jgi:uncharacterized protein involved in exopolysaccharide biosynthesis
MVASSSEYAFKQKSDPTLRDLLAPLFRRKRLLIITFSGVMLGTAVAAYIFSNTHKASMEILVNGERTEPPVTSESTQGQASLPPASDAYIGSEVELLKSPDLLQRVVLENKLQDKESNFLHGGANAAWYIARATQHLASRLKIQPVLKSHSIEIDYSSGNPQLAYRVLQSLGKFYLERHLAVHRPQGSFAFFASQTEKYQQALTDAETRLVEFTKRTGVAAPDLQRNEMAQHVVDSLAALQLTEQAIAADEHRIDDEKNRMKLVPERSLSVEATDSAQGLMQQLQADLLAGEIKKSQLTMKYDPSYPLVQEADQEIAQTQAAITSASKEQYVNQTTDRDPTFELMKQDVAKTQADLASHRATAAALETSIHSLQAQMVDLDQKSIRLADLNREVKADEANYLLYLSKREQERTSDALDEERIANVSIAVPPVVPILPLVGPVLIVAVGVVLAMFVSAGAAFLAEYLDPSLRTPGDVTEVLRIPVLASVPKQSA